MLEAVRERTTPSRTRWAAAAYAATIAAAALVFLLIREYGSGLSAPPPAASGLTPQIMPGPAPDALTHLLIALAAIVLVGRLLRTAFQAIGQPPVIGEVVAGVLLGPSLLGAISPAAYQFVLAPSAVPYLGIVAQLGVVLYMFLVGVELNPDLLRGQVHATVATSHASIVVPFVLGSALALFLYPRFSSADVPFTSFALFIGIAMAITAFPVLARILSELGMTRTRLGAVALACAAVDDVTAWCLLALVVGVVQASAGSALTVVALTLTFIAVMFVVVRPLLARLIGAAEGEWSDGYVAMGIVGLLISALVTEAIGIHALFGAFLFGAVIPHDSRLAHALTTRLESLVLVLLLPAFFAFAGMRTEIGLISGWGGWFACALIIVVATLGKVGGTLAAARIVGMSWRGGAALGVLMNTRGLMQLVVLNVGLDLGVISPTLFTMMVVMAIVLTMATTPLVRRLAPGLDASAAGSGAGQAVAPVETVR
jgi:Kef-type K+ transport system membrane component KefB